MTPEQVLSNKPKVLTQKQRESYFEKGYLLVERHSQGVGRAHARRDRRDGRAQPQA